MRKETPNAPCKECEERQVGCHSTCELYKEFRQKLDERNRKIEDGKRKRDDVESVLDRHIVKSRYFGGKIRGQR